MTMKSPRLVLHHGVLEWHLGRGKTQDGCGLSAEGHGLQGGRGVGRHGAEGTDGDRRKRMGARQCKKDEIVSVMENQTEERKTGVCLSGAWETIPWRCKPALSEE